MGMCDHSAMNKLRGGSTSAVTQLKQLVQSNVDALDVIWSWRNEVLTGAIIRDRINSRFGILLKRDGQLSDFWGWLSLLVHERAVLHEMAKADIITAGRRKRARWVLTGRFSKRHYVTLL